MKIFMMLMVMMALLAYSEAAPPRFNINNPSVIENDDEEIMLSIAPPIKQIDPAEVPSINRFLVLPISVEQLINLVQSVIKLELSSTQSILNQLKQNITTLQQFGNQRQYLIKAPPPLFPINPANYFNPHISHYLSLNNDKKRQQKPIVYYIPDLLNDYYNQKLVAEDHVNDPYSSPIWIVVIKT